MKSMFKTVGLAAIATSAALAANAPAQAQTEPYLGDIILVGFNFCPRGYVDAAGQLLPINSNQALFSLYGTMYGGDGRTTFAMPDMRSRIPMGTGTGPGLPPATQGARFGDETITMTVSMMPSHNHEAYGAEAPPNQETPTDHVLASFPINPTYSSATPTTAFADGTITHTGGGQGFDNVAPTIAMRYCVATTGLFPPRN